MRPEVRLLQAHGGLLPHEGRERVLRPERGPHRPRLECGCACPYGTTFSAKKQTCVGGTPPAPGPTPGGPFCVSHAPQNGCGKCATPEDCGGKKDDWSLCWANIDEKCTNSDSELVEQNAATSAESWQCYGPFGFVLKQGAPDLLHGRYESKEACEKVCTGEANEAETCLTSGNLGCLQAEGVCNYEKCTPCCAGLICYHDQDAGDMCMHQPPALYA